MTAKGHIFDDATGEPLPGVNVATVALSSGFTETMTGGTTTGGTTTGGTTTDGDGSFTVPVPPGSVIRLSYIGYQPQYPTFVDGISQNIRMKRDSYSIPEATVTAVRALPFWGKVVLAVCFVLLIGGIYYIVTEE
jgi:hypothetical protein